MRTLLWLLLAAPAFPAVAQAAPVTERAPQARTGLVFIANTGLEDLGTLTSSLRHAIGARQAGHLDEVVWIVYGRAILALDPDAGAVPDAVRELVRDAREAGVRLVACEQALKKFHIAADRVEAGVEVVPNAMDTVARLAAEGYSLLRY